LDCWLNKVLGLEIVPLNNFLVGRCDFRTPMTKKKSTFSRKKKKKKKKKRKRKKKISISRRIAASWFNRLAQSVAPWPDPTSFLDAHASVIVVGITTRPQRLTM
jgi:hypothetical protein